MVMDGTAKKDQQLIHLFPQRAQQPQGSLLKRLKEGDTTKTPKRRGRRPRIVLKGSTVVPGLAIGVAHNYRDILSREIQAIDIAAQQIPHERTRLKDALAKSRVALAVLQDTLAPSIGEHNAKIFEAHLQMLSDSQLLIELHQELERRMVNSEAVVRDVFKRLESRFRESSNLILAERADDVRDVGRLVLRSLLGNEEVPIRSDRAPVIILSRRLLPSDAIHFKTRRTNGIATAEGGINSHSAIFAKEFSLPYITNIPVDKHIITEGSALIVDGNRGTLTINPHEKEILACQEEIRRRKRIKARLVRSTRDLSLSVQDMPVKILANIVAAEDVKAAARFGCDGIGLYRLECLYMTRETMPTEDELLEALRHSVAPMKDRTISIRLLDTGGDKNISYLPGDISANSPLGLRGIRLLLHYPHLLSMQIRACLRLSTSHTINILIPLVTTPDDISHTLKVIENEKDLFRKNGMAFDTNIRIGAMIETPAALLRVDEILSRVDYLSIGTNDLIQYLMAADRDNAHVSAYYEQGNQMVIPLIGEVVSKARRHNKECSLCGELAGDTRFIRPLLECGLRDFSVIPYAIPELKESLRISIEQIQKK